MSAAGNFKTPSRPNLRKPKALATKAFATKALAPEAPHRERGPQGTLTRRDIALAIANQCENISKREAKRLVDGVIDEIVSTLTSGESLKLHDFGSFVVRGKAERAGRNPRTGERVPIEPRKVVVFKASPNMKAVVNGDGATKKRDDLRVAK
jgi:integration host factor subunit alpha